MGETTAAKTFGQWLSEKGISQNAASKHLGVSQQWVSMLCNPADPSRPSVGLLVQIEDWTGGQVSLASWMNKGAMHDEGHSGDPPVDQENP